MRRSRRAQRPVQVQTNYSAAHSQSRGNGTSSPESSDRYKNGTPSVSHSAQRCFPLRPFARPISHASALTSPCPTSNEGSKDLMTCACGRSKKRTRRLRPACADGTRRVQKWSRDLGLPPHLPRPAAKKRRAAGCSGLLLAHQHIQLRPCLHQYLVQRHLKERTQRIQVIHGGKALASLPLVDGLRLLKAEIGLQVADGQPPLLAQAQDIGAGGSGARGTGSPLLRARCPAGGSTTGIG